MHYPALMITGMLGWLALLLYRSIKECFEKSSLPPLFEFVVVSILMADVWGMSYSDSLPNESSDAAVWAVGTVAIFPWMMLVRAWFYKPQPDEPAAA